jgi:hypothetical protein
VGLTPRDTAEALALVQARTLAALNVATRALELADPTSALANDPQAWAKVGGDLSSRRLEVLHTAVMQMSGVSWETLATMQGVPRQSLHRRLAEKVRKEAGLALQDHGQRQHTETLLQDVLNLASRLKETVEQNSFMAAKQVVARSKSYRWWDSAGHA